jgi:BMFP domain-containing protein YqiC
MLKLSRGSGLQGLFRQTGLQGPDPAAQQRRQCAPDRIKVNEPSAGDGVMNQDELQAHVTRADVAHAARAAIEAALNRLWADNDALHQRVLELEAELALLRGSPGSSPTSETLTEYTHDVPPDAPR